MMIAFFRLDLNRIVRNSRQYPWPRPDGCGRCRHRWLWGHGYVPMFFDGFRQALQMRRYRCPKCGCIVRLRPTGFWPRCQSPVASVRDTLARRIVTGRWPGLCTANRARHWLAALTRNALGCFGLPALDDLMAAFQRLMDMGRVPVSRTV